MLDSRATPIVWAFMIGVIVSEGAALVFSFRVKANWFTGLLHYAATPAGTPQAWALAALVTVLYAGYAAMGSPVIGRHMLRPASWRPYAALRLVAVPMALISGFFEEAFFRKMLMDWAGGHSVVVQIALSALVFGAAHAIWGVIGGNLRAAAGAMIATTILGGALAAVYIVGGRSIGPCIAAHVAINLLIEPWLIVTAATNGWRRAAVKPA
jgi:membrane protease YdiL (CAAX protease family)